MPTARAAGNATPYFGRMRSRAEQEEKSGAFGQWGTAGRLSRVLGRCQVRRARSFTRGVNSGAPASNVFRRVFARGVIPKLVARDWYSCEGAPIAGFRFPPFRASLTPSCFDALPARDVPPSLRSRPSMTVFNVVLRRRPDRRVHARNIAEHGQSRLKYVVDPAAAFAEALSVRFGGQVVAEAAVWSDPDVTPSSSAAPRRRMRN